MRAGFGRDRSQGMTGLVRGIGLLALVGGSACAASDAPPVVEDTPEEPVAYESADPFALSVGDCFDDTEVGVNEVTEVPGLPCSEPHDNEVYALFDLPPGTFPGDEQVDASASLGCYERFEGAIGRSYEESEIDFIAMYPTEDSWTRIDDREVVCIAFHMRYEKLSGSVLESGR